MIKRTVIAKRDGTRVNPRLLREEERVPVAMALVRDVRTASGVADAMRELTCITKQWLCGVQLLIT
jgi:hypothetical protein